MSLLSTARALVAIWGGRAQDVRSAYQHAFRGDRYVLRDMAAFARVTEASPDDYGESRRIEGRREMFWHVANMLRIPALEVERLLNEDGANVDPE